MKKIEVITRPEKLVGLKEIFATHNCQGMTCLSVMGCGRQKGYLPASENHGFRRCGG